MSKVENVRQKLFHTANPKSETFTSNPKNMNQEGNQFSIQMQSYDNPQTKCCKLVQINENLNYNISILETELSTLKKMQADKIGENKKLKQKVKQKLQRQLQLKRHLQIQQDKIKRLLTGFKNLQKQQQQMHEKEQNVRQKRLRAQQLKNETYEKYNKVEKEYKSMLISIKQFDGLEDALIEMEQRNQALRQEIKEIENCLTQEASSKQGEATKRKQRNAKIKQLNQKVLELERQENNLTQEISSMEKAELIRQNERQKIQQKSAQALKIFQKIQQAKATLIAKKSQFTELDSTYKQLCIQQNRIKKEMILERQCKQSQKRYKQSIKNKPLQASKLQLNMQSPLIEGPIEDTSFNKLQNIVKRFQSIKNKNN